MTNHVCDQVDELIAEHRKPDTEQAGTDSNKFRQDLILEVMKELMLKDPEFREMAKKVGGGSINRGYANLAFRPDNKLEPSNIRGTNLAFDNIKIEFKSKVGVYFGNKEY